jgi:hypothetical protein
MSMETLLMIIDDTTSSFNMPSEEAIKWLERLGMEIDARILGLKEASKPIAILAARNSSE